LLRLYRGQTSFDFIGRRRRWFALSGFVILVGIVSLSTRGLNLGIDFKGGQSWTVTSQSLTVSQATAAARGAGVTQPTVVQLTNQVSGTKQIEVEADLNGMGAAKRDATEQAVTTALAKAAGIAPSAAAAKVSFTDVGPTWGGQVTSKAVEALIVFFVAVVAYISIRFEFKMALAALAAVLHDILVTVGIYSLTGFQVTPDTVIAVLTVLGYSLYDTVVVFDRVGDNAKGLGASGRITYSDMVNLSMNQTLARSVNTSLVAIMPVLGVLLVGSLLLGATTLENFGLALVIGLTSGAYSSIFVASPLLAVMKEREPRYTTIRQRLETRGGERLGILTPAAAAALSGSTSVRAGSRGAARAADASASVLRPGGARGQRGVNGTGGASRAAGAPGPTANQPARPQAGGSRPAPRPRKGKGKGKASRSKRR
jgi:preprotein translocase subunit SecF